MIHYTHTGWHIQDGTNLKIGNQWKTIAFLQTSWNLVNNIFVWHGNIDQVSWRWKKNRGLLISSQFWTLSHFDCVTLYLPKLSMISELSTVSMEASMKTWLSSIWRWLCLLLSWQDAKTGVRFTGEANICQKYEMLIWFVVEISLSSAPFSKTIFSSLSLILFFSSLQIYQK